MNSGFFLNRHHKKFLSFHSNIFFNNPLNGTLMCFINIILLGSYVSVLKLSTVLPDNIHGGSANTVDVVHCLGESNPAGPPTGQHYGAVECRSICMQRAP